MQANKRRYTEIIGNPVQFVIPVFQRDYSWMEEQCEQLWDDIERTSQVDGDSEHFFGPVVYISTVGHSAAFTRWLLIDGQQRMTTVSLLAAAMRDHIRDLPSSEATKGEADKIEHDFLINTHERDDDQKHKLVLRARDEVVLRAIVDGERPVDGSATLMQNYEFFRAKLLDADIDAIIAGVSGLVVVDVRLDRGKDDPQQIFESLNSTGIDLTQADLVRNYMLMGLEQQKQESLYGKYWRKIEQIYDSGRTELDNFLGDFVALEARAQKQVRTRHVYSSFRIQFEEYKNDASRMEKLLKRMLKFARYHAAFVMETEEFPVVADHLRRLKAQATTTPAILIMRLLDAFELEYITNEGLVEALELVESYLVRRSICRQPTRSYWTHFSKLAHALKRADVLGYLKVNLHWLSDGNYAFPTDRQFKRALQQDDLYTRPIICRFLLEELENRRSKERSDMSLLTIEHIMPQNERLSPAWRKMLGDNWKDVQAEWLHRLGNLTLTAYNKEYSDKPFLFKKNTKNGFKDSSLRLNKYVAQQEDWTPMQMRERAKKLSKWALDIWPSLSVSDELLADADVSRLRDEGGDIDVIRDRMDDEAMKLFDAFQSQESMDDIIEVAWTRSVSYHNNRATFFCEVIPRSRHLLFLLDLDVDECVECDLDVRDAADLRQIRNARYDGRCYFSVATPEDVAACKPLVRQALAASLRD